MITFCVGTDKITGLVLNLGSDRVSAVVLDKDVDIKPVNM
jgi:hypothetical protein